MLYETNTLGHLSVDLKQVTAVQAAGRNLVVFLITPYTLTPIYAETETEEAAKTEAQRLTAAVNTYRSNN